MLDQSFSADNFFRIFHFENRKGTFNRDLLSPGYLAVHEEVKRLFYDRHTFSSHEFKEKLNELNDKKDDALRKHLQLVSDSCNMKAFKFKLSKFERNGKEMFTVNHDAPSFFAMKQLQFNVHRTFKVKQTNRYDIVKNLRILLEDGFPKIFVKIDIRAFYQSIPQHSLLRKIDENQLLNFHSKKMIKDLIFSYEHMKNPGIQKTGQGIPRGVGLSAYLSELYMRDLDNQMRDISDICYYNRYVDDMVFIFIPRSKEKIVDYLQEIKDIITDHGLSLKDGSDGDPDKVFTMNFFSQSHQAEFNLLGYKFCIADRKLQELKLSDNKKAKYNNRIKATIEHYNSTSRYAEKAARQLLIKRIKFLTGNFHLLNNKKRIKSGIYYSNILINDNRTPTREFEELDLLLNQHLNDLAPYPTLRVDIAKIKSRIRQRYSFQSGFFKRHSRFHAFSDIDLNEIIKAWK